MINNKSQNLIIFLTILSFVWVTIEYELQDKLSYLFFFPHLISTINTPTTTKSQIPSVKMNWGNMFVRSNDNGSKKDIDMISQRFWLEYCYIIKNGNLKVEKQQLHQYLLRTRFPHLRQHRPIQIQSYACLVHE